MKNKPFIRLGELGDKVGRLIELRDQLSKERPTLGEDKWEALRSTVISITEAIDKRDLSALMDSARSFKNKLRRPYIKRELENLRKNDESDLKKENSKKESSDKIDNSGACVCSNCGKKIKDSSEPCNKDELCVSCAMKQKNKSNDEKNLDKAKIKDSLKKLVVKDR